MDLIIIWYVTGCMIAAGSGLAALSRGEKGAVSLPDGSRPMWLLVIEAIVGVALSWVTVGFCNVQNAYRSAGHPTIKREE